MKLSIYHNAFTQTKSVLRHSLNDIGVFEYSDQSCVKVIIKAMSSFR